VQITIIAAPRGPTLAERFAKLRRVLNVRVLAVAVAIAGVGAAAAGVLAGQRAGGSGTSSDQRAAPLGIAGVEAAYRYPLGCLSVTLTSGGAAYAQARRNRRGPCWRYGVYVTAVLRQIDGVWRLVLEAASPLCPALSLPEAVEAQVAVCEPTRRLGPRPALRRRH
jgi:hypothetical protein